MTEPYLTERKLHRWRPWHWYLRHPWRYSWPRRWLLDHSRIYRRFQFRKTKRAMRSMEKAIGKKLLPAVERTTAVMREWLDAVKAENTP